MNIPARMKIKSILVDDEKRTGEPGSYAYEILL